MGGWRLSALALLSVALLDSSPATAARGAASAVPQTGPSALPCGGAAAGRHLLGIGLRTELSETDGVNRAGAELEKIIHQRDIEMQKRARYVESKMHDMVTKPWATVHPLKLKRDERRDEALVRQAERQVKADQRLLKEAKTVSEHDKKLLTVAAARKSLQIDGDEEDAHRRQVAKAHLATKQRHAHSAALHPVFLPAPVPVPHRVQSACASLRAGLAAMRVRCSDVEGGGGHPGVGCAVARLQRGRGKRDAASNKFCAVDRQPDGAADTLC